MGSTLEHQTIKTAIPKNKSKTSIQQWGIVAENAVKPQKGTETYECH